MWFLSNLFVDEKQERAFGKKSVGAKPAVVKADPSTNDAGHDRAGGPDAR